MIEKIFICTDDDDIFSSSQSAFEKINCIEVIKMEQVNFWRYSKIDIIQMPTTFAEEFGSKPYDLDCQILATNSKYGLPEYIVTNPNFKHKYRMGKLSNAINHIEIPLKKVINFAFENKMNLNYGVWAEYMYSYFEKEKINFKEVKDILYRNLKNQPCQFN